MSRLDKPVRYYIIAYILILVGALVPQLIFDQNQLFLGINNLHSSFLDSFFYYITWLGDGLAFAVVIVILVLFSYRNALLGLIIFILTSGIAQLLKRTLFNDRIRPYGKLNADHDIYIPNGVDPLFNNSFPSGHTTTAFALAMFLVLILSRKANWSVFLVLAVLVGYSRIYLTHHFPIDVWTGSIIGTFGALVLYLWLDRKFDKIDANKGLLKR